MLTLGEFATFLEASAKRVGPELTASTTVLLEAAVVEAKAMIGHELEEWPSLAPRTIAEKQKLGYTGQVSETDPLLRTGQLGDSIGLGVEARVDGAEGMIGSEDIVALYQEMGTAAAEHPIPPRPFLAPSVVSAEARSHEVFGELAVELLTPGVR